jgi:hypothetical protein
MTLALAPEWWEEQGYLAGKEIGGGLWICLGRMIYTFRIMVCDPDSVYEFYCYPQTDLALAFNAFVDWDGKNEPFEGWTRHHG